MFIKLIKQVLFCIPTAILFHADYNIFLLSDHIINYNFLSYSMSLSSLKLFLLAIIFISFINVCLPAWRNDRRKFFIQFLHKKHNLQTKTVSEPKILGDRIPYRALMPHRKRIQKKIVLYHNYFRTKVIPRAANMLRMVRLRCLIS